MRKSLGVKLVTKTHTHPFSTNTILLLVLDDTKASSQLVLHVNLIHHILYIYTHKHFCFPKDGGDSWFFHKQQPAVESFQLAKPARSFSRKAEEMRNSTYLYVSKYRFSLTALHLEMLCFFNNYETLVARQKTSPDAQSFSLATKHCNCRFECSLHSLLDNVLICAFFRGSWE